jgi:hypothetical protein
MESVLEQKFEKLILKVCDALNYMYSKEYDENEKLLEVFDIVKNEIVDISNNREEFFVMFSEMFEKHCNEIVNKDYGFYEGLIVALCGGRL